MDESEVLYDNIAKTFKRHNSEEAKMINNLVRLWKKTSHIVGDGCITSKTIALVDGLNELSCYKKNDGKVLYATTNNRNLYTKQFMKRVHLKCVEQVKLGAEIAVVDIQALYKEGHKMIIFCEGSKMVNTIHSSLMAYGLPKNKIFKITASSRNDYDDEDKALYDRILSNPNDTLPDIDIFIYNSCILNGLSFEKKHFDIGIVISSDFGVQANDAINAIMRSRTTSKFYYYTETNNNYKDFEKFNDDIINELIENKKRALYNQDHDVMNNQELYEIEEKRKLYKTIKCDPDYDSKYKSVSVTYDWDRGTGQPLSKTTYYDKQTSKAVLEITQFEKRQFDTDEDIVTNNSIIKQMKNWGHLYTKFNDFNRAYKTEIFEQILIDKNNELNTNTENIIHSDVKKSGLKQIKAHIEKVKSDYDCKVETLEPKTIQQVRTENRNSHELHVCDKLDRHYSKPDDVYSVYQRGRSFEKLIEILITHRKGLTGSQTSKIDYNPNNTNMLLEILGTNLYDILDYKISNIDIKEKKLFEKLIYIAQQYRAEHKLRNFKSEKASRKEVDDFVHDANMILNPLMLNLEKMKSADGNVIENKITHNGARVRRHYYVMKSLNDCEIDVVYQSLRRPNETVAFIDDK